MERVILHCDLNNFFASVECLYHPEIREKPVAVCGSQSTRHGIVLAKNYIAKKIGIKTGEAIWEARQKCPELVTVKPNYHLYVKFSKMASEIYREYTDLVEAYGIDENWLDVTDSAGLFGDGEKIANEIRERVRREMGVTISVGVSFNKIFAKLGSDLKKPDAVTVITREDYKSKVWGLPVAELFYAGPSTVRKLNQLAIYTIGDLANSLPGLIKKQLGKWGEILWLFANGYEDSTVTRQDYESSIKSIGNSLTTPRDIVNDEDARILIHALADSVGERLRRHRLQGRTVQISIRDSELRTIERQAKLPVYTNVSTEIGNKAFEIFKETWNWSSNIRLLGVRATDLRLTDGYIQLSYFIDRRHEKREMVEYCIDGIRERFGHDSVQRAILIRDPELHKGAHSVNSALPISYFGRG